MKSRNLLNFTVIALIFLSLFCKNIQSQTNSDDINQIKKFYVSYITEISSSKDPNPKKIIDIQQQYCTSSLLKKIEKEELDADPFLKAQDANIESLKTLVVKKDPLHDNEYTVSYIDIYSEKIKLIHLKLKKEKEYKIDCVW